MTVLPSAERREPSMRVSKLAGWRSTLALIGVAIMIFAIGFHRDVEDAIGVWIESTAYNHCFLVLPVVGYLLWERRSVIARASPHPELWPLFLVPLLSAGWLFAAALDLKEGRQLIVVAMFQVILLAGLGQRVYRLLLAPLLFLFFLVPTGAFLVPTLQSVTAEIAVALLRLLDVPVFSDGYLIDIPGATFEIAEACAGLRFLVAATVFSCLFAVVMYSSWLRRGLYIALSIVVAITANGLRAFGIVYLAYLTESVQAVAADHVVYGFIFLSIVIALLIGMGMMFVEKAKPPAQPQPLSAEKHSPRWYALTIPLAALLALTGPSYAAWQNSLVTNDSLPASASPTVATPWHGLPGLMIDWRPVVSGADREYLESFDGPGSATVTRYVGLFRLRATGNRLTQTGNRVADENQWRIARQRRVRIDLPGRTVAVTQSEIVHGSQQGLVWSFYVIDGKIATRVLEAKLLQLRAVLDRRRPIGALVALKTASNGDTGNNGEEALRSFLAASQPFPEYIEGLRHEADRHQ